jgi:hypothetical protein
MGLTDCLPALDTYIIPICGKLHSITLCDMEYHKAAETAACQIQSLTSDQMGVTVSE